MEKIIYSSYTKNHYVYTLNNKLGEGAVGEVFKGKNCVTGEIVAIKRIYADLFNRMGPYLKTAVGNEVNILQKFSVHACPYIIRIYDCFQCENYVYIILEFCEEGTLEKEISKKKITEDKVKNILGQCVEGIRILHSFGITHRDIKTENIFIKNSLYKLGDFGFATQKINLESYVGTPLYMAPELLSEVVKYNSKVDIWAMGVAFYEMIYGTLPFKNEKEILEKEVMFLNVPQVSDECKDLILKMLAKNPNERLNAHQCLKHPFLAGQFIIDSSRSTSTENGLFKSEGSISPKKLFQSTEEIRQSVNDYMLNEEKKYIKAKLSNYIEANNSILNIVSKNLCHLYGDDAMIIDFFLCKRAYYHINYLYECLTRNEFPVEILSPLVSEVWNKYLNDDQDEYHQLKNKVKFINGVIQKKFMELFEDISNLPMDMLNSFLKKAVNIDIKKDFRICYNEIINDEINKCKEKVNSIMTTKLEKIEFLKLRLDLEYAIFVDRYLKNQKAIILCDEYKKESSCLKAPQIESSLSNSIQYFNKFLKPYVIKI